MQQLHSRLEQSLVYCLDRRDSLSKQGQRLLLRRGTRLQTDRRIANNDPAQRSSGERPSRIGKRLASIGQNSVLKLDRSDSRHQVTGTLQGFNRRPSEPANPVKSGHCTNRDRRGRGPGFHLPPDGKGTKSSQQDRPDHERKYPMCPHCYGSDMEPSRELQWSSRRTLGHRHVILVPGTPHNMSGEPNHHHTELSMVDQSAHSKRLSINDHRMTARCPPRAASFNKRINDVSLARCFRASLRVNRAHDSSRRGEQHAIDRRWCGVFVSRCCVLQASIHDRPTLGEDPAATAQSNEKPEP